MILVGNQRGGAKDLAQHLMKAENEHVSVHELRGFAAQSLGGALNEAYALSRGSQCRQFLFSLSVNPPLEARVSTDEFIRTIDRAERELGLSGQPRAIVFHEKLGRRHAHVVWSRIDADAMKAVPLPFTKRKLVALTRELFIEHGWKMPEGLLDPSRRDPRNFTLAEWQQARRAGKDPRKTKASIQDAWAVSDSKEAFIAALKDRGFRLARGDRRGFVVLDAAMEVYSVATVLGVRTRAVKERLGRPADLSGIDETKAAIAREMSGALDRIKGELDQQNQSQRHEFEARRAALVKRQAAQRDTLRRKQEARKLQETKRRAGRFRAGISGLWDRLRGEHAHIQVINEREAYACARRDQMERDALIFSHLEERRALDLFMRRIRADYGRERWHIDRERRSYLPEP